MGTEKKIGIVVADSEEFAPFEKYTRSGTELTLLSRRGVAFPVKGKSSSAQAVCVVSKIGKVNAAATAAALIASGCNVLLNFGLSGGISGVRRGELTIADRFLEHDFDLTAIGYKPCEKPGQEYIYPADARLLAIFRRVLPDAVCGTAVCGDRFICNEDDRRFLKETFGAVSCDMETGAVAAVCAMAHVPYIALRRVSDDAGADAESSYREMNEGGETLLADAFYDCLCAVADELAL